MTRHLPPASRLRSTFRFLLLGMALPCLYFMGVSLAFYGQLHAANAAFAVKRLPSLPSPTQSTRLLIFAPHCDDETLGCAGLLQQTLAAGGKAKIVFLTNGDAFRTAVECQTHSLQVTPADFIRFAHLRQEEAYSALGRLGLQPRNVYFLSYPDGGLDALWNSHWTPDQPFRSNTTNTDHSPYLQTFRAGAAYCGQDVLNDIEATMRTFRPTLVAVTHPAEDHADHAAAAAFVGRALDELRADPREMQWAKNTHIEYYLIHRGDYPLPKGLNPSVSLMPPAAMADSDTQWKQLELTEAQKTNKRVSIDCYASQTAMMDKYLHSFVRTTEIYGEIAPQVLHTISDSELSNSALAKSRQNQTGIASTPWDTERPVLVDPIRDTVLRELNGGADIRKLYAHRNSQTLTLRLECRQPVRSYYSYILKIRGFDAAGQTPARAIVLHLHPGEMETGCRTAIQGDALEIAVPWRLISPPDAPPIVTLALSAQTALSGVSIDKTGVRFLDCMPVRK